MEMEIREVVKHDVNLFSQETSLFPFNMEPEQIEVKPDLPEPPEYIFYDSETAHDDMKSELQRPDAVMSTPMFLFSSMSPTSLVMALNRPYQCRLCPRSFDYMSQYVYHMGSHTGHSKFQCDFCAKGFSFRSHLVNHRRIHTGERPYQCNECQECFQYSHQLQAHCREMHGDGGDRLRFGAPSISHRQPITSASQPPFRCKECGECFSHVSQINQHVRSHTGQKRPYQCCICDKAYTQSNNLRIHMRSHNGERPYQCVQCDKAFASRDLLKSHTKVHTDDRPFCCPHCAKAFTYKYNLNTHLRIHTGEKPYECRTCNQSFDKKCNLTTHTCNSTEPPATLSFS